MKIVIIVQARLNSTRLPGKILKEIFKKPLLELMIERLKRVNLKNEIVIATTQNPQDNLIVELCNRLNIPYFRGSENDVLSRCYKAARKHKADVIVRVTSDCPLIDPGVVDKVIAHYLENLGKYDYVSNIQKRSFPRGMDTEVFSFNALEDAYNKSSDKIEREHVTPFIYTKPNSYSLDNISYHQDESRYRLTVDTMEDFILVKKIFESLYFENPGFTLENILRFLKKNPEVVLINSEVRQKPVFT